MAAKKKQRIDGWGNSPEALRSSSLIHSPKVPYCTAFLKWHNYGLKYLNALMRIRYPGWRQFGSGMEKSRIRAKRPGSATMIHNVDLSMSIRRGLSLFLYCMLLRGKNLPEVTSRDSNSSLPYCTAGQCTTNWAMLHPTELRCTLIWKFIVQVSFIVLLSPLLIWLWSPSSSSFCNFNFLSWWQGWGWGWRCAWRVWTGNAWRVCTRNPWWFFTKNATWQKNNPQVPVIHF